ncbi:MAG: hypothetical protein KDA75_07730 [Planctomycetaceae bacterium]|nr:hypothetical protein [Planctomycetaceae bacterium]
MLNQLQELAAAQGGRIELLTGVAAGADLEAAEAARELDIPVHITLPLPELMFHEDFGGDLASDWPRAQRLIEGAKRGEGGSTLRIDGGGLARPGCYHETNLQLLLAADVVIAVWNGERTKKIGGTDEFVDAAARLKRPHVIIDPARDGKLERRGNWADWPQTDHVLTEVNRNVAAFTTPTARGPDERGGDGSAWQAFVALDEAAKSSAGHFRRSLYWSVALHFLAALIAACTAAFSPVMYHHADTIDEPGSANVVATSRQHVDRETGDVSSGHSGGSSFRVDVLHTLPKGLTLLEFLLVSVALRLMWQSQRRHAQSIWRSMRFAAEVAHSQIMTARLLDPLKPLIVRHEPRWRRFALGMSLLAHRSVQSDSNFEQLKTKYLEGRIVNQGTDYFRRQLPHAEEYEQLLSRTSYWAAITAPIFIGVALFLKLFWSELVESDYLVAGLAAFLPVALPLVAGAATSMIVATDVARRAERYRIMAERLDHVVALFPEVKTSGALGRIAAETEEILLDELIEWYAAAKSTGH